MCAACHCGTTRMTNGNREQHDQARLARWSTAAAMGDEVSPVELLFDLVFVFAISQLSHHLLDHLTWRGALETGVLLMAVFGIWALTSFGASMPGITRRAEIGALFAVLVLGLFFNAGLTHAFEDTPWLFAAPLLVSNIGIVFFYLFGVQILGAVAAYVLSMALGAALALVSLGKVFPGLFAGKAEYEARELSAASAPMIVANVTQYSNLWTAVVVLGVFEPVPTVGVYSAAARTAALSSLVLISFAGVFSPLAAGLYRQNRLGDLGRLYADVSRWAFTGALAFFLVTALLSRDVMLFFGREFAYGWPVVVVISAAQLFNSSVGPTARLLAMTGFQKAVMVSTAGSAIAAVVLNLLLVPRFGVGGAAAATAAALVLSNGSSLFFVRGRLGFWPYGPRYARPILAGLAAAVLTLGIRALLPTVEGLPALLLFAPLVLVLFACALVSLGLYPSDRRFLASFGGALMEALGRKPAR